MWWFRWHSRRLIRSIMNPIDPNAARVWERRLRLFYMFLGWNAFLFGYFYWRKNKDKLKDEGLVVEDVTSAHKKARQMGLGDVKIIRIGVNQPTETYSINTDDYSREYNQRLKKARKEFLEKKAAEQQAIAYKDPTILSDQ